MLEGGIWLGKDFVGGGVRRLSERVVVIFILDL